MRSLEQVAIQLAKAHKKLDRKTRIIKFFPNASPNEICLLEVSDAIPYTGEVLPFRFNASPVHKVEYPSTIVLISPREWTEIQASALALPEGWDISSARDM